MIAIDGFSGFSKRKGVLRKNDSKRENRWTERIAVGSSPFIERIKNARGAMARGRSVHSDEGAFELREAQSAYNSILTSNIAMQTQIRPC